MASTGIAATKTSTRPTFSCIRCAERKVKCDRQKPHCSACAKHNVDCNFNASKPTQKKQKRIKVQVLTDQLKRYEDLLIKNGIVPSNTVNDELPDRPSHIQTMQEESHQVVSDSTGQEINVSYTASSVQGHENLKFVEKWVLSRNINRVTDICAVACGEEYLKR